MLEVPGGLLDPGETPEATPPGNCEETGYQAETIRLIGKMMPNPAINTAYIHIVVAEGCRLAGDQNLDPFERIEVIRRPLSDIPGMIGSGEIAHALVVAAFTLAGIVRTNGLSKG